MCKIQREADFTIMIGCHVDEAVAVAQACDSTRDGRGFDSQSVKYLIFPISLLW